MCLYFNLSFVTLDTLEIFKNTLYKSYLLFSLVTFWKKNSKQKEAF